MTRSGRRAFFQAQVLESFYEKISSKISHVFKQGVIEAKSVLVVVFMRVFAVRLAELVIIAVCAAAGTVDSAWTRSITIWMIGTFKKLATVPW